MSEIRFGGRCEKHLSVQPCPTCANESTAKQNSREEWVNSIMEQAQVFASAWSLVGGPFDFGDGLAQAEAEKVALRKMLKKGYL